MKRADLVQSCVVALGAVVCVFGTSRVVIAAETLVARLHPVSMEGSGVDPSKDLGTVSFSAGNTGAVVVDAQVKGLPPGKHGFHIHRDGSCGIGKVNDKDAPGGAAGPHFDPAATGKHLGPDGAGHAGDLPNLEVKSDGTGTLKASTTKIKLADLAGKTVIVHASPDYYTDEPPNGGSGARIACGVVEK